jgi:maltose alpha-D-glucosyltransferase/alpha-amylase
VHVNERFERYTLPLTAAWEDAPSHPFEAPLALGRVRRGRRIGLLTDAFASPVLPRAMVRGLRTKAVVELSSGGRIVCRPTSALANSPIDEEAEIHWPGTEQTNSTLLIGRQAVVKMFRRLTAGTHPEAEMSRYLTEHGFSGAPALLGDIVRVSADGQDFTLAVVQRFVDNQGDGWAWSLDQLKRIVDEGATPFGHDEVSVFSPYLAFARTLGRRLGEMHATLAQPTDNTDFAPAHATAGDVQTWRNHASDELEHAMTSLAERAGLGETDAALAREIHDNHARLRKAIGRLGKNAEGALRTRIHGDFHLGQVLVASADVQIIDFEGEPKKSLAQRRAKASPLRDIAGLIRSFDYVAAQVGRTVTLSESAAEGGARAEELLQRFRAETQTCMLQGYGEGAPQELLPVDMNLLDLFILEKAAYEVGYEAANRPEWLVVPLRGLARTVRRILEGDGN